MCNFSQSYCMYQTTIYELTSRKQGFGSGRASPLVPVQSRTGTHGGICPGSLAQGAGRGLVGIGPGSYGPICPGSRHESGLMGLAPGPQTLVPVLGSNRDRRLGFSPGSSHEPGQMICLYIPRGRSRALHNALFFLAGEERVFGCSSSPPMHTKCSMKCPSHAS